MQSKLEVIDGLNYEAELNYNNESIANAIKSFNDFIIVNENKKYLVKFKDLVPSFNFFIPYRIRDLLIACTDDMCRYALYHDVKITPSGLLDISPAARAVFYAKWVIRIRPCLLDIAEDESSYFSISVEGNSIDFEEHVIVFCNEYFAAFLASIALNIKIDEEPKIIFELMEDEELRTFLYHLRYRIPHQDTLNLLFNRLKSQEKLGNL